MISPGTLLGVLDPLEISERDEQLESGETLLLYTDGLLEGGASGEQLGEHGLGAEQAGRGPQPPAHAAALRGHRIDARRAAPPRRHRPHRSAAGTAERQGGVGPSGSTRAPAGAPAGIAVQLAASTVPGAKIRRMGVGDQLLIEVRREQDRVVVRLDGELDMANAPSLKEAIEDADHDEQSMLVLDLQRLQFIDSTGLRTILATRERCQERGHEFAVTPGSDQVQRLFSGERR